MAELITANKQIVYSIMSKIVMCKNVNIGNVRNFGSSIIYFKSLCTPDMCMTFQSMIHDMVCVWYSMLIWTGYLPFSITMTTDKRKIAI